MKTIRVPFLVVIITLLSFPVLHAQVPELINDPQFRPQAKAAVDSIYNFNFQGAETILEPWKEKYPDHPLWLLMESMTFWWQVLSDLEDTSHDEQFFYMMKRTDYEASKLLRKNSSHADGLIIKAVSNGYIARQHANRDEWLSSVNRARRALSAHEYLLELQPEMADLKLAEGLKLYYSAYLPEAYPIVKTVSWFMPEGDKKKGLEIMQTAADSAVFARAEATYFLGNINYNYEQDYDKAVSYFKRLYQKYPHNNYYARLLVKSYYRMRRYDDALKIIDRSLERWEQQDLPFKDVLKEELLTWKGRILFRRSGTDQSKAIESLKEAFALGESLPKPENRSFHVVSGYYLGKLYCDEGKNELAEEYLKKVSGLKAEPQYRESAKELMRKCNNL